MDEIAIVPCMGPVVELLTLIQITVGQCRTSPMRSLRIACPSWLRRPRMTTPEGVMTGLPADLDTSLPTIAADGVCRHERFRPGIS